jgi:NAD(P)-dependent dehydrogenase (short-subunit alcohol dehydrogenase family)
MTALVTGSTSSIRRAVAVGFGAEGARVVVSGRNKERGDAVERVIRAKGGRAEVVAANLVGSPSRSLALPEKATRVLNGRIDILVNNAGIFSRSTTPTTDEATFELVFAVNVKAPYFPTAASSAVKKCTTRQNGPKLIPL